MAQGAKWEPVGQWRRPYCYPRAGETPEEAVHREVRNTRQSVGLLDASTLGKLHVKGPDAGTFLDMMYTNMMSTLPVGRCRYGLMCNEDGFLIDPSLWSEELGRSIAAEEGVHPLTAEHWRVISHIRGKFLLLGALPNLRQVCRATDLSRSEIKGLFGHCLAIWRIDP